MPHIHVERRPAKSPALGIILAIIVLLILAALVWYFVAGPGRAQFRGTAIGSIGTEVYRHVADLPGIGVVRSSAHGFIGV